MSDLSELFAQHRSNEVEWNGMTVHGLFEFDPVPDHFSIRFMQSKSDPVQGIRLKSRNGKMVVNGLETGDPILWRDTSPDLVDISFLAARKGTPSLKLWNAWRSVDRNGHGTTMAWIGNSAMKVDGNTDSGRIVLRCSDGRGDVSFDDLVVEILIGHDDPDQS